MTVWFTSDTHYGHSNVIQYSNRPFKDAQEMDEILIRNWNELVRPGDRVYHLGDFALCREDEAIAIARRLMGQKHLVFGNHDKRLRKSQQFLGLWQWARDLTQIEVGDQKIVLCHYAMLVWNQSHRGSWQLHGHSHGSLPEDRHSLRQDVGVDVWDHRPVSFEEIREVMASRDYRPVDHHGQREGEQ